VEFDRYRILRYRNNMPVRDDVAMTRALERGQLPDEGFPHALHLRVAWVYLAESASVGKAEKYSQATTEFWMHQVAAVRALMPGADIDAAIDAYPRLLDKNLVLAYYSS